MDFDEARTATKVRLRCEELGEDAVRKKIADGLFTDEWRVHAERWLTQFDFERERGNEADAKRHAKSAKIAAWAAAIAAIVAAIAAVASAVIAYQSLPS